MRAIIFFICTFFVGFAQASFYVEGDLVKPIELQDQFENEIGVNANTQVLLFSRNMKGGDIIKEALETLSADEKFDSAKQVYVADVSGMPSLIAKFVAIPQMKGLPFPIGLDREGEATKMLPGEKDKATLIQLENFKIVGVEIFDSSESLLKAL
ncbi:hypothetical protein [Shewanella sp. UCD-KL12]|uniref:hypothetical protein n=1 Tax=Shewanella sp. UCD-KL12 TaxID=1917163 RepID=UPI0009705433|nr:hypothetical protein [Shewanella sp. UCD-KL12]